MTQGTPFEGTGSAQPAYPFDNKNVGRRWTIGHRPDQSERDANYVYVYGSLQ